jgi:hypothetical protein
MRASSRKNWPFACIIGQQQPEELKEEEKMKRFACVDPVKDQQGNSLI